MLEKNGFPFQLMRSIESCPIEVGSAMAKPWHRGCVRTWSREVEMSATVHRTESRRVRECRANRARIERNRDNLAVIGAPERHGHADDGQSRTIDDEADRRRGDNDEEDEMRP